MYDETNTFDDNNNLLKERELSTGYHYFSNSKKKSSNFEKNEKDIIEMEYRNDDEDFKKDWNERFQCTIKKIRKFNSSTPLSEKIKGNIKLLHLAKDFIYTAQMYGKIIIR